MSARALFNPRRLDSGSTNGLTHHSVPLWAKNRLLSAASGQFSLGQACQVLKPDLFLWCVVCGCRWVCVWCVCGVCVVCGVRWVVAGHPQATTTSMAQAIFTQDLDCFVVDQVRICSLQGSFFCFPGEPHVHAAQGMEQCCHSQWLVRDHPGTTPAFSPMASRTQGQFLEHCRRYFRRPAAVDGLSPRSSLARFVAGAVQCHSISGGGVEDIEKGGSQACSPTTKSGRSVRMRGEKSWARSQTFEVCVETGKRFKFKCDQLESVSICVFSMSPACRHKSHEQRSKFEKPVGTPTSFP